ncbi:response regulator [Haloferula sp. A504]|uniref:response regulator n=1 Tax=Haloferula sp. A504 TaxID=3373601 RepID=UPI0031BDC9FC|nr:response regulator transcription factor [Verrucomicrobiaceae bacterium E54]
MSQEDQEAAGQDTPIRVLLVEDQPDTGESWRRLISSFPDFECGTVCGSAEEALEKVSEVVPGVILMDVFLPGMSGIECTARLKANHPEIPIVMLTASDEDEILFHALESGADGYLLKRTKPADLRAALLDVLSGGAPMTSEIARHVVASFRKPTSSAKDVSLTSREEETLVLLTEGYSNKEIADRLGIGVETVRSHLKNIYSKMHVRSRTEAVVQFMSRRPG